MDLETVKIEQDGHVVIVTLNDPATLNALGQQLANDLREAIRYVRKPEHGFRCLVLTGAGRGFCSGGSVTMMNDMREAQARGEAKDSGISLGTHHHYVLKLIRALDYPVITAVNGPAAGLGMSYALIGDLIVAKRSAFFLQAFRTRALTPDGGASWLLPRLIGWARAKELMLMGDRLPAETALEWGLINRVFDDETFGDETMSLARELAAGPTVALGLIRRLAWDAWDNSFEQQLDLEERTQPVAGAAGDAAEGVKAFVEKREPIFQGR